MHLYVIRHAEATGQEPEAALTERGEVQARRVSEMLHGLGIVGVVSSPWRRAVATILPFGQASGHELRRDARLVELRLAGAPRASWREDLRQAFADPERVLEGGESVQAARARALAAVEACTSEGPVAVCTHGALAAILLGAFDRRLGFETWAALGTPDLFEIAHGRVARLDRLKLDE